MLNRKKNNKGFTLVELLVVIAIIGILAVVAVPTLFKNIEKSKVAKLEGNISAIKSAALGYYADKSEFYETTPATAVPASGVMNSGLGEYLEDLNPAFTDEKYLISGAASGDTDSVLTITFTKPLSTNSVNKLAEDLSLTTSETTSNCVTSSKLKITILDKK